MPERIHPARSIALVALAFAGSGITTGYLLPAAVPVGWRVGLIWLAFLLTPGALWQAARPRPFAIDPIRALSTRLMLGALHDLAAIAVFAVVGLTLRAGLILWCVSLLLPLSMCLAPRRPLRRPPARRLERDLGPGVFLTLALAAVTIWMAAAPSVPRLTSDLPAHLGAVHDAANADRWIPPDRSVDAGGTARDPRFGVGHGLDAAIARAARATPMEVLRFAPVVLSPLWLAAHAWLFAELGLPIVLALIASLLFTIGGAGGSGFGLWEASYPGNLALSFAALGLAAWLASHLGHPRRRLALLEADRWTGPLLVAFTVWIHPFAWWALCVAAYHAVVLLSLRRANRRYARRILATTVVTTVLGTVFLLPVLLSRSDTAGSFHYLPSDVMFLNHRLFIIDPLAAMRWAGWTMFLAAPLALLLGRAWFRAPRPAVALGAAFALWTIGLDPLVEPLVWKVTSYLTVRLGRVIYGPALWMIGLGVAAHVLRRARRGWPRGLAVVTLGVAAFLLFHEARDTWNVIRWETPRGRSTGIWKRIESIDEALRDLPPGAVLTDPRTSYALRALRGGPAILYPAAHASPRDRDLPRRLQLYREILDRHLPPNRFRENLRSLGAVYLLIDLRLEELYRWHEFGFVPRNADQRELALRLAAAGARPIARGPAWRLYRVSDLLQLPIEPAPRELMPLPPAADVLEAPVNASRFRVVAVEPGAAEVAPGDSLRFRLWYRERSGEAVTLHPGWERVYLRFQGPMQQVPHAFRAVDKLYRKILLERSGRSEARFGWGWVPFQGELPPARWGGHEVEETRSLYVPEYVRDGDYEIQLTVQEAPWIRRRYLRDYLSDRDSYTGPVVGHVRIRRNVPPGAESAP